MSMAPVPTPPVNAGFSGGYSPDPHPGLPNSPQDKVDNGTTDGRATRALVLGILGIFPLSILAGIPAILAGSRALTHIRTSDGALTGRWRAWSGIVLGCLSIAAFAAFVVWAYL